MHASLRAVLLFTATAAVTVAACGGNVVVDGASTGTTTTGPGGLGGSPTSTGDFGGSTDFATVGTGFGGGPTTVSVGTGFGGDGTTAVSTVASTSGTGGGAVGCLGTNDSQILDFKIVWPAISMCGEQNVSNQAANQACIMAATGLSTTCTSCLTKDLVPCTLQHCLNECVSDPNGVKCAACRQQNCEAGFEACAGVIQPGTAACSTLLGGGPATMGWPAPIVVSEILTQADYTAYQNLDTCACLDKTSGAPPGCADVCDGSVTGTMDWCNDVPASQPCQKCLISLCQAQLKACSSN